MLSRAVLARATGAGAAPTVRAGARAARPQAVHGGARLLHCTSSCANNELRSLYVKI